MKPLKSNILPDIFHVRNYPILKRKNSKSTLKNWPPKILWDRRWNEIALRAEQKITFKGEGWEVFNTIRFIIQGKLNEAS